MLPKWLLLTENDGDLPWLKLAEGVKAGKTPCELAYGKGLWQYFKEHPEREHVFSQAMVSAWHHLPDWRAFSECASQSQALACR